MACFLDSGIKGFDCLLGSLHFPNLCIASNDRGESNAMKYFLRFFSASFIKWDHRAGIRCHCPSPSRPGAKIVFPFGVPESEVNTNARRNFYACSRLPFLPLPFLYFLEWQDNATSFCATKLVWCTEALQDLNLVKNSESVITQIIIPTGTRKAKQTSGNLVSGWRTPLSGELECFQIHSPPYGKRWRLYI